MDDRFIVLKCSNCGTRLQVYNEMTEFACGECGAELTVHRRGGTVSLSPTMAEAISRVQVGTDRTAAELAIARLNAELERANSERFRLSTTWKLTKSASDGKFVGVIIAGAFLALFGLVLLLATELPGKLVGAAMIGACALCIKSALKSDSSKRIRAAEAALAAKEEEIRQIEEQIRQERTIIENCRTRS